MHKRGYKGIRVCMNVSIVIPNWNGEHKLKKNLPRVLKLKGILEIIVVDDTSTDGSVSLIEKEFPEIKLIKRQANGGFSSTVNIGVKNAKGDLVFLLNSDAVPEEDCLKHVLPHFKEDQVFSVGCNVGGTWVWGSFKDGFFWHWQFRDKSQDFHQTLWASGGSGIFRKSIWDKLGGLDELFDPFYEEDVDLGYRATKRGYINIFEPRSEVEHYKEPGVIEENFSKSSVAKVAQRNQLLFIWKNIHDSQMIRAHILKLIGMLLTKPGYWQVFLPAFSRITKILEERAIEKKAAKISDEQILSMHQIK